MPDIFPLAILYALLDGRYLMNSTTPQDGLIPVDAHSGDQNTTLLDANNPGARPVICTKVDASANICNFIDPNGGTFPVDIQYQAIRLIPLPAQNIWVKQG